MESLGTVTSVRAGSSELLRFESIPAISQPRLATNTQHNNVTCSASCCSVSNPHSTPRYELSSARTASNCALPTRLSRTAHRIQPATRHTEISIVVHRSILHTGSALILTPTAPLFPIPLHRTLRDSNPHSPSLPPLPSVAIYRITLHTLSLLAQSHLSPFNPHTTWYVAYTHPAVSLAGSLSRRALLRIALYYARHSSASHISLAEAHLRSSSFQHLPARSFSASILLRTSPVPHHCCM